VGNFATHRVDQVWRYTETAAPTGTADFHIYNNVQGADTAARVANATSLANAQMSVMAAGMGRGGSITLISSTVTVWTPPSVD
jgi:hypothetical protein